MGGLLGIIILVLDIIVILDIVKGSKTTGKKGLWIVLVLIFPLLGLGAYYLIGRKK